jgi:hypothetical protein
MTYVEEFETELRKKLEGGEKTESIISWCREKILESYRNGASTVRSRRRTGQKESKDENETASKGIE